MADAEADKKPVRDVASAKLPEPSQGEKNAILAACTKLKAKPRPVRLTVERAANGQSSVSPPHANTTGWLLHLAATFGSSSIEFAMAQLNVLTKAIEPQATPEESTTAVNAMLAAVAGVQPRDEIEGSLAVQMAATHHLAMTLLDQARRSQHGPALEIYGNMALKLMRTYTAQVEALAKLRRGGNQTVRVEHVHVHSGGQAIVGNVTHPGGGGGANKRADRPHAPEGTTRSIAAQPVAPLWSENPEREPMPSACGQRASEVPDARRREG